VRGVKQLRTASSELRAIFDSGITAAHIAEPLASFGCEETLETVRAFLRERDFDIIGVRSDGHVCGFAARESLTKGVLGDHVVEFGEGQVVASSDSVPVTLQALREKEPVFVESLGQVGGIVTRGDLQKVPVRLWLFGLVSLLEMQMLRVIRVAIPEQDWDLTETRRKDAEDLLEHRRQRNEHTDLADCLQFCDKRDIILRAGLLPEGSGFDSKSDTERFFRRLEELRNNLAHAQDIVTGCWPELGRVAQRAEQLLKALEQC